MSVRLRNGAVLDTNSEEVAARLRNLKLVIEYCTTPGTNDALGDLYKFAQDKSVYAPDGLLLALEFYCLLDGRQGDVYLDSLTREIVLASSEDGGKTWIEPIAEE